MAKKEKSQEVQKENNKFCQPGFFRFRELDNKYLLTNEVGDFIFLKKPDFKKFSHGKLPLETKLAKQLGKLDFLKHNSPRDRMITKYHQRNEFLFYKGASLHIVVVTLRCNHHCLYCQAGSVPPSEKGKDMDLKTAKKTVDFIFSTPNNNIGIEFQGGEPLINWPTVKFITEYARKKNKKFKKNLQISIVSNFSLMEEEKLKFFFDNGVQLCTSLDGPEYIHNKNRPLIGGTSYDKMSYWLKRIFSEFYKRKKKDRNNPFNRLPGALLTVSRYSLKYPKEIIDEYFKWGFETVSIRQVNCIGFAKNIWEKVGYKSEEFINFYKKALNYLLIQNQKGRLMREREATIFFEKILSDRPTTMLDVRSPCGAAIGQILYFYDGSIYSCDEGRMAGAEIFKLGDVYKNNYKEIINNPKTKALCLASCLENTLCDFCVYKPYCGVCPVVNYITYGNIFAPSYLSERCQINKKILDHLFKLVQDKKKRKIFELWIDKKKME